MAINPGVYPLVPGTPVGNFRLATNDTQSVPLVPPVAGYQSYTFSSDDEILMYIAQGGTSQNRAIGYYYVSLSAAAAKASKSIKDYDLALNTEKRAGDLLKIAQFYFGLADEADAADGSESYFNIGPTGTDADEYVEYFPYPYPGSVQ